MESLQSSSLRIWNPKTFTPGNLKPKSPNREPNNMKRDSLEFQSLKHANSNLKANSCLTYTNVK